MSEWNPLPYLYLDVTEAFGFSKSGTWSFCWRTANKRINTSQIVCLGVWCTTGFKEQLIMTLWTHLWNREMRDRRPRIFSCHATWTDTFEGVNVQQHPSLIFVMWRKKKKENPTGFSLAGHFSWALMQLISALFHRVQQFHVIILLIRLHLLEAGW